MATNDQASFDDIARFAKRASSILEPIDLHDIVGVFREGESELDERVITTRLKEAGRLDSGFTDRWTIACLDAAQVPFTYGEFHNDAPTRMHLYRLADIKAAAASEVGPLEVDLG